MGTRRAKIEQNTHHGNCIKRFSGIYRDNTLAYSIKACFQQPGYLLDIPFRNLYYISFFRGYAMDIQVQELIDKIKKDGIESASGEATLL